MTMISVKDSLPKHMQRVLVKLDNGLRTTEFAIAQYDQGSDSFDADSSGYDVYADDDSGMYIELDGEVTHWMAIED